MKFDAYRPGQITTIDGHKTEVITVSDCYITLFSPNIDFMLKFLGYDIYSVNFPRKRGYLARVPIPSTISKEFLGVKENRLVVSRL